MASLAELEDALVNADKAGDVDAAKMLAAEINRQRGVDTAPPKMYKIGAEGLPDAVKAVAGDFSPHAQLAVGFKAGMDLTAQRLRQLFGGATTPQDANEIKANRALLEESPMARLGDMGFDLALTGMPAVAGYGAATKGLSTVIPQWLARSGAAGIMGAAIPTVTQPVLQGESGLKNAGAGAVGGILGDAAFRTAARALEPVMASPKVQELLNRDITPTIGQAADEKTLLGRFAKSAEEKLQSVPLLGDIIKNARLRPHEEVNLAALRTVYPDAKEIGHKGVAAAEQHVSDLYESALGKFKNGVAPDQAFLQGAFAAPQDPRLLLSPEQQKQYANFLDKVVLGQATNGGTMEASVAKKIDSEIGTKVRDLMGSSNASERDLGRAFQSLQSEFRGLINRSAPTAEVAAELADANRKWANFVRIRDAAASSGAREGVFTPSQLLAAVRRNDASVGKGRFAKGEALLQDLAGPARDVLGDTVKNSGTTDRMLLAHLLSAGIGGGAAYATGKSPVEGAAMGAVASLPMSAFYSGPGQRYALGGYGWQQPAASFMRSGAPYGAAAGGILAGQRTSWMGEGAK